MSPIRRIVPATAATGAISVGFGIFYTTSDIKSTPVSATDPIFNSNFYKRYNPNDNPPIHDLHVIRLPLNQIDSTLLQDPNKLLERYCGGIWAGAGFTPQRILHTWFEQPNANKSQLWSRAELLQSDYKIDTDIAGNFEVVDRSEESILIRGGDKTSNRGLRVLDGLIELTARIDRERDVAEFGFKSLFFQGAGTTRELPMPGPVVWLHELYAKILLRSGVRYVLG
ncbi:hypothetical protein ASPWEDRAFT_623875 [Aspergillus wentii DTO 134E9]|uniref:Uncharacterized protein n=1 Tax=Aspergillus wentii DTO 134E9 TaxID=1073089 RepID=A0A1L9RF78_ASPWE|nr:uncharacterized protein ASPWEDRAFT_623875 [Aspergillus wentii DTO 134E9]KAI9926203.1 hypothetical protein MW887_004666 [Aspergillus wentii]OJJ33528.1 hypothetical protein ASPWEDRAFT_623875 [Aspergillus wentii DTO 134E9]